MALSHGMNHPAVMTIAGQLDTDQHTVADLMQRTTAVVNTLGHNWFGNDASQFATNWASHSRALQMAADALEAMSKHARAQAADQQHTSTS